MRRLCRLAFFRIGIQDTRQLTRRGLYDSRNTGGRGLDQSDKLATQFIERRQCRQRFDAGQIQHVAFESAADNDKFVVLLGVIDGHLGGGNGVL